MENFRVKIRIKKQVEEKRFGRVDRWWSLFSICFSSHMQYNIDIDSIVDQRDWVGTRRTYYKMRDLFLDRRKNIARSPHAPMLLFDATYTLQTSFPFQTILCLLQVWTPDVATTWVIKRNVEFSIILSWNSIGWQFRKM